VRCRGLAHVNEMCSFTIRTKVTRNLTPPGQALVIAAGMSLGSPGTPNLLTVAQVDNSAWDVTSVGDA